MTELRGDLDWIVMKCLEKDRARRFETANGLARDIQRHLGNEPVVARPPSAAYRLAKFIRRHRKEVFFATLLAVGIVAGVIAQGVSLVRAKRAMAAARRAQHTADEQRARAVAERQRADELLRDYQNAARLDASLRLQKALVTMVKSEAGPDNTNTLEAMQMLAGTYQRAGRLDDAFSLLEETLRLAQAKFGADHPTTLGFMHYLAMTYHSAGWYDKALPLQEQILRLRRAKLGPNNPATHITMMFLAEDYEALGRVAEAVSVDEEMLKLDRAKLGPDKLGTLSSMHKLAMAYQEAGRLDEALPLDKQMFALAKAKYGLAQPETLEGLSGLLCAYLAAGRLTEAEGVLHDVVAPALASQPQSPGLLRARGLFFARSGRWLEAAADLSRAIELKPQDQFEYQSLEDWQSLAAILVQAGDLARYRDLCRKPLEQFASAAEPQTAPRIAKTCLLLPDSGANLQLAGRLADMALPEGTNSIRWPLVALTKALAEYRQEKFASASAWVEKALSARTTVPPAAWPPCLDAEAYAVLAMARYQLNQDDLARAALASAQEVAANKLPKPGTGDLGKDWLDWIIAHALVREAEGLIEGRFNHR